MNRFVNSFIAVALFCCLIKAEEIPIGSYVSHTVNGRSVTITTDGNHQVRLTAYGDVMLRVQAAESGESFLPDSSHPAVVSHNWGGALVAAVTDTSLTVQGGGVRVEIRKSPLRMSFYDTHGNYLFRERGGVSWVSPLDNSIHYRKAAVEGLLFAANEHFIGGGNISSALDAKGKYLSMAIGSGALGEQHVPFAMSSKGYGLYSNASSAQFLYLSDHDNQRAGQYDFRAGISVNSPGQIDYFVIPGADFPEILDKYTRLTGRAQFPPKAVFGLWFSDKGSTLDGAANNEEWWKNQIQGMRDLAVPYTVQQHDNTWHGGGRCSNYFKFSETDFPNPAAYEEWSKSHGTITMLDWNACTSENFPDWQQAFSLGGGANFFPDFTSSVVREWFWQKIWDGAANPSLHYPFELLWLDEFEPDMSDSLVVSDGRTWAAMESQYDLLQVKSVVEGWTNSIGDAKRPFILIRGMGAGGQRYSTTWTGDIGSSMSSMREQIRAGLTTGMSGFPFTTHDGGGFVNKSGSGDFITQDIYLKWICAFGSFQTIWRPHGYNPRWPMQRNDLEKATLKKYAEVRFRMMPYIYSMAWEASQKATPMMRPMVWDSPATDSLWTKADQYYWGPALLVKPSSADGSNTVSTWLPHSSAMWYNFWTEEKLAGNTTTTREDDGTNLSVFVREGAIIPMAPLSQSTLWINHDTLVVHVYAGANGRFTLYDDDGVTSGYKTGEYMVTPITFNNSGTDLSIGPAQGTFAGAPSKRAYQVHFHGLSQDLALFLNGQPIGPLTNGIGKIYESNKKILSVYTAANAVGSEVRIYGTPTITVSRNAERSATIRIHTDRGGVYFTTDRLLSEGTRLSIYDSKGRLMVNRILGQVPAGTRYLIAERRSLVKGVYNVRVTSPQCGFISSSSLVNVR